MINYFLIVQNIKIEGVFLTKTSSMSISRQSMNFFNPELSCKEEHLTYLYGQ